MSSSAGSVNQFLGSLGIGIYAARTTFLVVKDIQSQCRKERLAAIVDTGPSVFTPEAEGIRQTLICVYVAH